MSSPGQPSRRRCCWGGGCCSHRHNCRAGFGLFDLLGVRSSRKRPGVADLSRDRTGHRRRGRSGAIATPALHGGRRRWTVPVALVVLAAVFLGTELATTRFDADKPLPDFVQYTLNADTGQASWLSAGERPDAWTV